MLNLTDDFTLRNDLLARFLIRINERDGFNESIRQRVKEQVAELKADQLRKAPVKPRLLKAGRCPHNHGHKCDYDPECNPATGCLGCWMKERRSDERR